MVIFCTFVTVTPYLTSLSLHYALPISAGLPVLVSLLSSSARRHQNGMSSSAEDEVKSSLPAVAAAGTNWRSPSPAPPPPTTASADRKSTRLNSSHVAISYAVFCLKKKK